MSSRYSTKLIALSFIAAVQLAFAYSVDPSFCKSSNSPDGASIFRPISLLKDDTDNKIRSITIPQTPRKRPEKTFDPGAKLTLDDTLSIVDTHYPKLLQGHIEVEKASARILESQGAFDPFLQHISEFKRIQDIVITGKEKDAIHNEGQLELPTRSGIRLFGRVRVNPNDASTPFLQSGQAGEYTAGAIIPLMRGLGVNKDRATEQKARLGQPLSAVNLNLSRLNVLFDAAVVYWDWYIANQKVEIVKGLLDIGENREKLVRERVAEGDLPALDIKEAEKEVRIRRGDLYKVKRALSKASFKLALFLWSGSQNPPVIDDTHVPDINIAVGELSDDEVESGIKTALRLRPELTAIAIKKSTAEVDLKLARNLMLPEVSLIYRQGADTGKNGIGMVVAGGVKMSIPLRQRRARGLIEQSQLELRSLDIEEEFLRRRIRLEVEDAASELNAAYNRFVQAGQEVEKASAVEAGERQRFDLGNSSLFLVNRRERERAEAQQKRVETYGECLKALAALNTVTGRI